MNKWCKALPVVAVVAALLVLLMVLVMGPWLGQRILLTVDAGETRRVIESTTLTDLLEMHPDSVDDEVFRMAVTQALDMPYVVYIWLFASDGRVVEGNRSLVPGTAGGPATAETSATDEMRRVIGILAPEALNAEQRTALLAASAMQKEGEHNDVFRHLLHDLRGPAGELVGWIGITYDVSSAVSAPGAGFITFVIGLVVTAAVYWLSLPAWVWIDARLRGERAWVWAMFVLLGNLVALIAYLLARPPYFGHESANG
ncbi:MAG: hypothetical protein JXA89_25555 [Anaerolineae bacterium]|nr:hypothetical protein [Anaerolineae bacterium]